MMDVWVISRLFLPCVTTVLQWIYVSIDLQTTLSSCKINCQKWNYEVRDCMFTFKFLIEMVRWLLQEKIVSYLLHTSCSLLGAERNAKRMPEGLFPSRNFHLHCVPNPRECLGCLLGWVGGWVCGFNSTFKLALQTLCMVSGTSLSLYWFSWVSDVISLGQGPYPTWLRICLPHLRCFVETL